MEGGVESHQDLDAGVQGVEPFLLKFGRCVLKAEGKLAIYVCQSNLLGGFSSSKKYCFRSGFCDCHLYLISWKFHLWREFSDYGRTLG